MSIGSPFTNKILLVSIKQLFRFGLKTHFAKSLNAESINFCHYMIALNTFNLVLNYDLLTLNYQGKMNGYCMS